MYNSSLERLERSENDILNLTSETADLTPFDIRIFEYQLNASSLQVSAAMVAQRQSDLLLLYGELLNTVNETLRSDVQDTNSTLLVLENDFTTTYILALSAKSLMNRTLEDFIMVTQVLDEVERVRIPAIMAQVDTINSRAGDVNETAMVLQYLSRNLSLEIAALRELIERVMSESRLLMGEAESLDWIQQEVIDGVEDLRSRLPSVRSDAEAARSNLSQIESRIMDLERRVRSKFPSIPNITDASQVRNFIQRANESKVYARVELLAEIQRQQRKFSAINETYASNLMRFESLLANISNIKVQVNSHLHALRSAYAEARNITAEGNVLIGLAEMVAENLGNFSSHTFMVQDAVDEALADVNAINDRSRDAMALGNELQSLAKETEENILIAKDVVQNASRIANASLEVLFLLGGVCMCMWLTH